MTIRDFSLGIMRNNCYVISNDFNKACVIIDAPQNPKAVIEYIKENGLKVSHILITHNHFDHIDGLDELQEAFNEAEVTQNSVTLGEINIQSITTPGHTQDSVCFYIPSEKILFSGDTLFCENIGRTDYGGNLEEELASIKDKLFTLPPQVKVYPGHGEPTNIEHEIKYNPYF